MILGVSSNEAVASAARLSARLRKSTAFVAIATRTAPVGPITSRPSARRSPRRSPAASPASFVPEEQALAGCLVAIGCDGALQMTRGLVKAADRPALERLFHRAEGVMTMAWPLPCPHSSTPRSRYGYSAPLIEELTTTCTAAMRAELSQRSTIAMAAMLHPLLLASYYGRHQYLHMHLAVEVRGERKALDLCIKQPEAYFSCGIDSRGITSQEAPSPRPSRFPSRRRASDQLA